MSLVDERTTTPGPRMGWWISGGVLWAVVIAALVLVVKFQRSRDAEKDEQVPEGTVLAASPDRTAKPTVAKPVPASKVVAPSWDPKGIEDFSLTERSGRTVTKKDLLGKPFLVGFIFTTCAGPCLTVSGQMAQLQEKFAGTDIRLVTISVLPEVDTPAVLKKYADAFGADPERWLFLTGDKAAIYHLIQSSFRMPVKELTGEDRKPGWEVVHTTNLVYVDENGVVRGKYDGKDPEAVAKLLEDVLPGAAVAEVPDGSPSEKETP